MVVKPIIGKGQVFSGSTIEMAKSKQLKYLKMKSNYLGRQNVSDDLVVQEIDEEVAVQPKEK